MNIKVIRKQNRTEKGYKRKGEKASLWSKDR